MKIPPLEFAYQLFYTIRDYKIFNTNNAEIRGISLAVVNKLIDNDPTNAAYYKEAIRHLEIIS